MAESKPIHYISVDIETEGLDETTDRVLEIGAVVTDESGQLVDMFHTYINYDGDIDFSREAFVGREGTDYHGNGITAETLETAPFSEVALESEVGTIPAWELTGDGDDWAILVHGYGGRRDGKPMGQGRRNDRLPLALRFENGL